MKMIISFGWFWPLLKFFLFEWRFPDWPWNVVILLGFQVPVPYFDLIFGICHTCRCEITWTIISGGICVFSRETLRVAIGAAYSIFCQNDDGHLSVRTGVQRWAETQSARKRIIRDPTFGEFVPRLGISATFGEMFGELRYLGIF